MVAIRRAPGGGMPDARAAGMKSLDSTGPPSTTGGWIDDVSEAVSRLKDGYWYGRNVLPQLENWSESIRRWGPINEALYDLIHPEKYRAYLARVARRGE